MSQARMLWTREQILSLAPDAQVSKAAQSLSAPAKWRNAGCNERVVWGEHQGSGSKAYQVVIDLEEVALKCSCPSRKQPCKHAIGLLLAAQATPRHFKSAPVPDWVQTWLDKRAAVAARKESRAEKPGDAAAQAKRVARREERIQQGLEAFALWLEDLVRQGLGDLPAKPASFWEAQAARLVDAQAPGLASDVRALASIPHTGEAWPARLLEHLGRLMLLIEAYGRLDVLPPALQAEVRARVGWTQDQAALLEQPGMGDCWVVVHLRDVEEEMLRVRSTWLWGLENRHAALLLDFAGPGQTLGPLLPVGAAYAGELVFFEGAFPERALFKEGPRRVPLSGLSGYETLETGLAAYAAALARNPWLDTFLMPLTAVTPTRQDQTWAVYDRDGRALPLRVPETEGWRLMGISGGRPIGLAARWDGARLTPLSIWDGNSLIAVSFGGEAD